MRFLLLLLLAVVCLALLAALEGQASSGLARLHSALLALAAQEKSAAAVEVEVLRRDWREFLLLKPTRGGYLTADEADSFLVLIDELPRRAKQLKWSSFPRWRVAKDTGCCIDSGKARIPGNARQEGGSSSSSTGSSSSVADEEPSRLDVMPESVVVYCMRLEGPVRHVPFNVPHDQLPKSRLFPWFVNRSRAESMRLHHLYAGWKVRGQARSKDLDPWIGQHGEVLRTDEEILYDTVGVTKECRAVRKVIRLGQLKRNSTWCTEDANAAAAVNRGNNYSSSISQQMSSSEGSHRDLPCGLSLKKRALVLYVVGTEDSMSPVERTNLDFFYEFGVVPDGVATAVFSAVDIVFILQHENATSVRLVNMSAGNVFYYETPKYHCDLATHAMVIDTFAEDFGFEYAELYGTLVMLNRGVRGPFLSDAENPHSWIDVIGFLNMNRTVVGISISYQIQIHVQSFFVAIPGDVVPKWRNFYMTGARSMKDCMFRTETHTLYFANSLGLGAYSLSQGAFAPKFRARTLGTGPLKYPVDPCTSMFVKFGGTAYKELDMSLAFEQSVLRLTAWQRRRRERMQRNVTFKKGG